jgi:hypothetical protein
MESAVSIGFHRGWPLSPPLISTRPGAKSCALSPDALALRCAVRTKVPMVRPAELVVLSAA